MISLFASPCWGLATRQLTTCQEPFLKHRAQKKLWSPLNYLCLRGSSKGDSTSLTNPLTNNFCILSTIPVQSITHICLVSFLHSKTQALSTQRQASDKMVQTSLWGMLLGNKWLLPFWYKLLWLNFCVCCIWVFSCTVLWLFHCFYCINLFFLIEIKKWSLN